MEKAQKVRRARRTGFTKAYNLLVEKLSKEPVDEAGVDALFATLQQKYDEIRKLDESIFEIMLERDAAEGDLEAENESADGFVQKFNEACASVNHRKKSYNIPDNCSEASTSNAAKRKFKLPQVELKKFSGDIKEWLPFWSQFTQIDSDDSLDAADKFNYLWQATIPGSRARQVVASYPQSRENYPKVVEALKARFGRQDLLVEVYVRELLKLVILNSRKNNNTPLSVLYDTVEAHLRALETLDVVPESCAAILFPLVESCLPEDLLRIWQRTLEPDNDVKGDKETPAAQGRLKSLMSFIRREVQGEERVSMAMAGFDRGISVKKTQDRCGEDKRPTAACLLSNEASTSCIFCDDNHPPANCTKAFKIPYEERRKLVVTKRLCFARLKSGHVTRWCRAKLSCPACKGRHVKTMCPGNNPKQVDTSKAESGKTRTEQVLAAVTQSMVLLQTVQVLLVGEKTERRVRALFDSGSQRSYLLSDTAKALDYAPLRQEKLTHALFGGLTTESALHDVYRVRVYSLQTEYACNFEVLSQELIARTIGSIPQGPWVNELQERDITINDDTEGPIELLLGADVIGRLLTGRRTILSSGLVASETMLGWTLMGKTSGVTNRTDAALLTHNLLSNVDVVSNFWDLETLGIRDPSEKQSRMKHLADVNNFFDATVDRGESGRYIIRLPWKEGVNPPLSTYSLALDRTRAKHRRLKIQGKVNTYQQVFQEWQEDGIIEPAPPLQEDEPVYYLPHRPVFKNDSTTAVRPVFDASAKVAGSRALNDCLEVGENLIENIPNILIRCRLREIGVSADIRKAFLQIEVAPEDRNFLRFFLCKGNEDVVEYRHVRLVFGLCCSPFVLGAVIRDLVTRAVEESEAGKNDHPVSILKSLLSSFYVDNFLTSVSDHKELDEVRDVAVKVLERGNFDLRGWESTADENSLGDSHISKVLGMTWNRKEDTLSICAERLVDVDTRKISKRVILSVTQKIFDPIGFTAPTTLIPKIMLQKLWQKKLRWDEEVDAETADNFLVWCRTLAALTQIAIPRWAFGMPKDRISLHVFTDASKEAYAAVIFVRVEPPSGQAYCRFICAKARVAPLKATTIPRLELLAAVLGSRLYASMRESLNHDFAETHLWTDSTTILAWIQQDRPWGVFVFNRVEEIRQLTPRERWRHVSGSDNPADFPSRGGSTHVLLQSQWWMGPEWLRGPPASWPSTFVDFNEDEIMQEKRKMTVTTVAVMEKSSWFLEDTRGFETTVRLLGWMRRFLHSCRDGSSRHVRLLTADEIRDRIGPLTTDEIREAERAVIILIQRGSFAGVKDPRLMG